MGQITGRLDREIRIERKTVTQDAYGAEIETFGLWAYVWAEVRPVRAQERFQSSTLRAERAQVFKIRYREGLSSTMRIIYDGLTWNIRGITEIGRREIYEILAEAEE